jgi:16S rRNA (guanine(527)-N(7))-methyltransferase RsmG
MDLPDRFRRALEAMGLASVAADVSVVGRLLEFASMLQRWNVKIRLVGPSDLETIVLEQLVDSLGFVHAIRDLELASFWDVGAGGGLPGLPLAIIFPDREFTLVEPIHKKTSFLSHASATLGLRNVRVHTGRVEADGRVTPPLRTHAEAAAPRGALSRATLGPVEWLETARALLGPDGTVLIALAEETSLPDAVATDPASRPAGRWRWVLPATGAPRTLLARTFA